MEDEPANKRGRVEPKPQEPPTNVDFINSHPDEMLVTIISNLPVKYDVRTTVLTRRWRSVDHEFCSGEQQRLDALFHVLATHPGPELSLHARRSCSLPPSVFRLVPTLRRATFRRCIFPWMNAARALHLPKLKDLEHIAVRISKEDLERLLVGCTVLEYLRLHVMDGFSSLHITSMNVRAIYVHCWSRPWLSVEVFHDIVSENAPFLERLYVHDKLGPILAGPKVENVGEYNNPIECLDLHLTEITFNEYRGTTPEIKFARFFVEKARLLKVMRFALYLLHRSEWIAKERMHLQLNGKGSAQAEFQFVTSYDRLFGSHCIKPLYDFSVPDPFAEIMHEKDSEGDELYVSE
ncbi:uncharacterized protein [Aegilops tauschii subsp. strangulata]|uniref:uncharacterized protein n=1 Tax=Aegilops tauschii subsp. strangulata TaxID=200361 RepID=UPI003CC85482